MGQYLTEEIQENIFGFAEPDQLGCALYSYQLGHKVLELKIAGSSEADILLVFDCV